MSAEEKLEQIKALLFDEKALSDIKRLELLEHLYDRVSLYYVSMKKYEAFFESLQDQGAITPFPADWRQGEIGAVFAQATRDEAGMFAVMREIRVLEVEGKA